MKNDESKAGCMKKRVKDSAEITASAGEESNEEKLEEIWASPSYFYDFKNKLSKNRTALMKKFRCKAFSESVVPCIDNEVKACVFCLGRKVCWVIYPDVKVCKNIQMKPPLLSVLLHLSQYDLHLLIQHMYKWYQSIGLTDTLAKWFFAVLMCIESPLISYNLRYVRFLYVEFKKDYDQSFGEESKRLRLLIILIPSVFYIDRYEDAKRLIRWQKLTREFRGY